MIFRQWFALLLFVFAACFTSSVFAIDTHTKLWTATIINGSIVENSRFRYYVEEDTRFIDDKYKFQSFLIWLGAGYRLTPTVTVFVGDAPNVFRTLSGTYIKQNTLWQQVTWDAYSWQQFHFMTVSRFQETKREHEQPYRYLLRQLQQFTIPLDKWKGHNLILADSVFFDINNPTWSGYSTLISQNRAFIGIETKLSEHHFYTIGYMNQYVFRSPNVMYHILVLNYNITNP